VVLVRGLASVGLGFGSTMTAGCGGDDGDAGSAPSTGGTGRGRPAPLSFPRPPRQMGPRAPRVPAVIRRSPWSPSGDTSQRSSPHRHRWCTWG